MTLRPAIAAVHLQRIPLLDQIANRHQLEPERLRLAIAVVLEPGYWSPFPL
jgi:hypothetical protein